MQQITQDQLIDIIAQSDANHVTVKYSKPVDMNVTGNPFFVKEGRKSVPVKVPVKTTTALYGFGINYGQAVNKAIRNNGGETEYEVQEPSWAESVIKDKVIRHKGTGAYYLRVYPAWFIPGLDDIPEPETTYYIDDLDGNELREPTEQEMEDILKFMKHQSGVVQKQANAGLGEYDQIQVQNIKFDNIDGIDIDNELYELV